MAVKLALTKGLKWAKPPVEPMVEKLAGKMARLKASKRAHW
jgi:hypothetical protein